MAKKDDASVEDATSVENTDPDNQIGPDTSPDATSGTAPMADDSAATDDDAPAKDAPPTKAENHASTHGLSPRSMYVLGLHNEPMLLRGVLAGTNELGVLLHAVGSRFESFHPWSAVKSLTRES